MEGKKLTTIIPFLILSLAVIRSIAGDEQPKEKPVDVAVEGMVYCQSCDLSGTQSLIGAKPMESATISVICKDHRNRVSFYKPFQTDKNGYFYAELKGFKMSHSLLDHPLHACKVKLVASPEDSCNLLTNVNSGLYGAPLQCEDKRLEESDYEAVVYAAGPLAFQPSTCGFKAEP